MNSSSTDPSEALKKIPSQAPASLRSDSTDKGTGDGDLTGEEQRTSDRDEEPDGNVPKTLLLKRAVKALFVPAILPEETRESGGDDAQPLLNSAMSKGTPSREMEPVPADDLQTESTTVSTQPTVEFLPPPTSVYRASLTLELLSDFSGSSIRYALDAEDVDESGSLYDPVEKILLTQSTTVAARTFVDGKSGPLALARFEIAKPSWQKLEPVEQSDPTTHEQRDEAVLEGAWRLAAASVRGKLHAHRGGWREDAYRHDLAHASDGTYSIIVMSDGAGSAPLSRIGSNLACQTALDFLRVALQDSVALSSESKSLVEQNLPQLRALLVEAAQTALQRLREEAAQRARPLADFASTLLILVRREWQGQQLCAALQSGDGGIALWDDDDTLTLLGEADHGEHSSETRFLTTSGMENELAARVKFSIRPNLRALAVMTDGVADDFFPEATRFPDILKEVLPLLHSDIEASPGAALLDWIDYAKKGSSDDRTLVVCWRETKDSSTAASASTVACDAIARDDKEGRDDNV